jgi:RNA polymerase sigma factor (sigma-70 family)
MNGRRPSVQGSSNFAGSNPPLKSSLASSLGKRILLIEPVSRFRGVVFSRKRLDGEARRGMGSSDAKGSSPAAAGASFKSTHWSVVRKACNLDSATAVEALSQLCRDYWYPLYAFVRRRGYSPEDAQDLTQAFFARLLEKHFVQQADRTRGRFRAFLLSSLENFLNNEWDKGKTIKRGGRCFFVSWETLGAEDRYGKEPFSDLSADKLYERRWVMTLLEKATDALRREHEAAGEQAVFEALLGFLSGTQNPEPYKDVAARLNLTQDAVRVRVHRLKRRFGKLLREVVADTVEAGEIDDEMRHLFTVFD